MTISDNYAPNVTAGNGSTTVFTGNWSPFNEDYIRVYLEDIATGVQTLKVLDTDYTLSFTSSGYTVTFITAPSSAYNVIVARDIPLSQGQPFRTSLGFQGELFETSLDRTVAILQDLADKQDRSLMFPLGSSSRATLPEPSDGRVLGWDGTNLSNLTPNSSTYLSVTPFIETLLNDIDAAAARATLGAAAKAGDTFTGNITMSAAAIDEAAWVDVASASTTNIGAAASNNVRITGTTTITSLGTYASGAARNLRFADALTFTYNATSLILPGAANITTAAGDTCTAISLGSGNWVVTNYQRANGAALLLASQAQMEAGINTVASVTPQSLLYYPGIPVALVSHDNTGAIQKSWNVSSVTKVSTGIFRVNLAVTASSSSPLSASIISSTSGSATMCFENNANPPTTTTYTAQYNTLAAGNNLTDPSIGRITLWTDL